MLKDLGVCLHKEETNKIENWEVFIEATQPGGEKVQDAFPAKLTEGRDRCPDNSDISPLCQSSMQQANEYCSELRYRYHILDLPFKALKN